ncbi:condensation domain-containing protein, partial [Frankia sp. AgB32]|uniref:condensation domain-containing protein n=1 Tax=Frankia sp. AgB32 TaxID=631119 RepID=UPI0020104002
GDLDRVALRAALRDVVVRHESLRTVFPDVDGVPRQEVLRPDRVEVFVDELVVSSSGVAGVVEESVRRPFDLAVELPVRARLLVVGSAEFVLVLVVHHIAGDGWSLGPLGRDLAVAYRARCGGEVPGWSPLPVQYADYSLWQRELLGDDADPESVGGRQLAFWRETLAGLPEELNLPTDR